MDSDYKSTDGYIDLVRSWKKKINILSILLIWCKELTLYIEGWLKSYDLKLINKPWRRCNT